MNRADVMARAGRTVISDSTIRITQYLVLTCSVDMGCDMRWYHILVSIAPFFLLSHLLCRLEEVQVYLPLRISRSLLRHPLDFSERRKYRRGA